MLIDFNVFQPFTTYKTSLREGLVAQVNVRGFVMPGKRFALFTIHLHILLIIDHLFNTSTNDLGLSRERTEIAITMHKEVDIPLSHEPDGKKSRKGSINDPLVLIL